MDQAYKKAFTALLAIKGDASHWTGCLSASALSTATTVSAFSLYRDAVSRDEIHKSSGELDRINDMVGRGCCWLMKNQNRDGGWGDTDCSLSNISTTFLVKSALVLAKWSHDVSGELQHADRYLERQGGVEGIKRRYGKDLTFSVPILTNAALAGLVPWNAIPQLPFELAAMPQSFFRFFNLRVVSYAIPALVAIGLVRFRNAPGWNFPANALRRAVTAKTLNVIERMQPESGGYLEASPLTAFVCMSLIGCGLHDHPVVRNGLRFLIDTVLDDGSWPIDVNLATWGTTLAINAVAEDEQGKAILADPKLLDWLLECQHKQKHPFTGVEPGGWGWTDLSGSVPDADDTSGALLALAKMFPYAPESKQAEIISAAIRGVRRLLDLQNRDGGIPTFCRGWGKLPFDRSGVDLTAHALRAVMVWSRYFEENPSFAVPLERMRKMILRGQTYLDREQKPEGCWQPLWFGNQFEPDDENPVYGTARVLCYLGMTDPLAATDAVRRALRWTVEHQNHDGGWGCRELSVHDEFPTPIKISSVEETAIMVEALHAFSRLEPVKDAYRRGLLFLLNKVQTGAFEEVTPIGLYFAKLWYYEKLYPVVFTTAALAREVLS